MNLTKRKVLHGALRAGGLLVSFFIWTALSSAFSPIAADESTRDRSARHMSMGAPEENLYSPLPASDYDALHSLQSGIRSPDEIQNHIGQITGQGSVIPWVGDFWQKNKIQGPLKLVSILSHVQNLETRFEVMHLLTLPGETRRETAVTLFTDRLNDAEISTLHSSIAMAMSIVIKNGRPVYDPTDLERFNFHLTSASTEPGESDLREPEGQYDLAAPISSEHLVDPFAELNQVNGSFNEVGNYEYDQQIAGQHCTVTITPRWNVATKAAAANLTLEIQIHEAESLTVRSFVLVYQ